VRQTFTDTNILRRAFADTNKATCTSPKFVGG